MNDSRDRSSARESVATSIAPATCPTPSNRDGRDGRVHLRQRGHKLGAQRALAAALVTFACATAGTLVQPQPLSFRVSYPYGHVLGDQT
jgi:hypothetical protein